MVRVIYIGGLGRSGTTLLERILGELPGVCALGEVVHLWQRDLVDDERCACGAAFSACAFWGAVGDAAFGGWSTVDTTRVRELRATIERTRHIPRLAARRLPAPHAGLVTEYAGYYTRVYAAAAAVRDASLGGAAGSRASTVVDSSKHSALAFCLRWAPEVDLRVVQLVRDSRGVAYSWTKTVRRPESDGQEMTRYTPGRCALLWNAHNAAFGLLRRRGTPVLRLRYEELLADPAAAIRTVAHFADLDPGPLDFLRPGTVRLGTCHSAAGNPMRFATGEVPLRPDNAWRTALPAGQRRLVGALTSPLLTAYGYGKRQA